MLRTLDLFSGIGGFSLGLERTGAFETVAFCEIDPFRRAVLSLNWPKVPIFNDVKLVSRIVLEAAGICVDAVTAGFPCQDLSRVGKRAGLAGKQSGLWSHVARLVGELRPGFVLLENVPDLLARGMEQVLGDLAAVGYDAEWEGIPAAAVGASHLRSRQWILAYPAGFGDRFPQGLLRPGRDFALDCAQWPPEPDVVRVADGLPDQSHRLASLGDTLVPQIPELIGRAILARLAA